MTNELNGILDGTIQNVSGWGIAFKPQVENLTGLTDTYEVQFFTRHTQTFYEPHLETTYNGKSDILRYLILYIHGGIYIDADSVWINEKSFNELC